MKDLEQKPPATQQPCRAAAGLSLVLIVLGLAACQTREVQLGPGKLTVPTLVTKNAAALEVAVEAPSAALPLFDPNRRPATLVGDRLVSGPDVPIPLADLRRASVGTFQGQFTGCAAAPKVQFQLREVASDSPGDLGLEGTVKTYGGAAVAGFSHLEWALIGQQDKASGLITFQVKPRPAKPDKRYEFGAVGAAIAKKLDGPDLDEKWQWFTGALARDVEGLGWVGELQSKSFPCKAFAVRRIDGSPSGVIPNIGAARAFQLASLTSKFILEEPPFTARTGITAGTLPVSLMTLMGSERPRDEVENLFGGVNWLVLAAQQGHPQAPALLGRILEFGYGVPVDVDRAKAYYLAAAKRRHAGALWGLLRLAAAGSDVSASGMTVAQLKAAAADLTESARQLCLAQSVRQNSLEMIYDAARNPGLLVNIATTAMDRRVEIGSLVLQQVVPVHLATPEAGFICKFTVKQVGTQITSTARYKRYREVDASGRVWLSDNRSSVDADKAWAALETEIASITPYIEAIQVEPLGGRRYQLSYLRPGILVKGLSAQLTRTVGLN